MLYLLSNLVALLATCDAGSPWHAVHSYRRGCYFMQGYWPMMLFQRFASGQAEVPCRLAFVAIVDLCFMDTMHLMDFNFVVLPLIIKP